MDCIKNVCMSVVMWGEVKLGGNSRTPYYFPKAVGGEAVGQEKEEVHLLQGVPATHASAAADDLHDRAGGDHDRASAAADDLHDRAGGDHDRASAVVEDSVDEDPPVPVVDDRLIQQPQTLVDGLWRRLKVSLGVISTDVHDLAEKLKDIKTALSVVTNFLKVVGSTQLPAVHDLLQSAAEGFRRGPPASGTNAPPKNLSHSLNAMLSEVQALRDLRTGLLGVASKVLTHTRHWASAQLSSGIPSVLESVRQLIPNDSANSVAKKLLAKISAERDRWAARFQAADHDSESQSSSDVNPAPSHDSACASHDREGAPSHDSASHDRENPQAFSFSFLREGRIQNRKIAKSADGKGGLVDDIADAHSLLEHEFGTCLDAWVKVHSLLTQLGRDRLRDAFGIDGLREEFFSQEMDEFFGGENTELFAGRMSPVGETTQRRTELVPQSLSSFVSMAAFFATKAREKIDKELRPKFFEAKNLLGRLEASSEALFPTVGELSDVLQSEEWAAFCDASPSSPESSDSSPSPGAPMLKLPPHCSSTGKKDSDEETPTTEKTSSFQLSVHFQDRAYIQYAYIPAKVLKLLKNGDDSRPANAASVYPKLYKRVWNGVVRVGHVKGDLLGFVESVVESVVRGGVVVRLFELSYIGQGTTRGCDWGATITMVVSWSGRGGCPVISRDRSSCGCCWREFGDAIGNITDWCPTYGPDRHNFLVRRHNFL